MLGTVAGLALIVGACGSDPAATTSSAVTTEVATTDSAAPDTVVDTALDATTTVLDTSTTLADTTVPTTDGVESPITTIAASTTVPATAAPETTVPEPTITAPIAVDVATMPAVFASFLLEPVDVDPSFQTLEWTQPVDATSCGVDLAALVPVAHIAGTFLSSVPLNLSMLEEIRGYATVADAERAFRDDLPALTCGVPNGLDFGDPLDATADLGLGFPAVAVPIGAPGIEGVLIVVQASNAVLSFQFLGSTGASAAAGIKTPLEVAAIGLEPWQCCDD